MSMKQIETLVFDYGGVIVNIDDASVVKSMESLGVTAFKRLIHTPIRDKIAISCMLRQIHEFSSHAIRHGLYIKNRKRLFCP